MKKIQIILLLIFISLVATQASDKSSGKIKINKQIFKSLSWKWFNNFLLY